MESDLLYHAAYCRRFVEDLKKLPILESLERLAEELTCSVEILKKMEDERACTDFIVCAGLTDCRDPEPDTAP